MKRKINNISAITLSMVMGMSYTGNPIYAQEIEKVINTKNVVSEDSINEKENISNIDETTVTIGKLTITGNPSNYTYQNGTLTIIQNGEFTLSGELGVPDSIWGNIYGVLKINDNLDNVTINFDNLRLVSLTTSAVSIGRNSKLKIYLKGKENTIVCKSNGYDYENIVEGVENGNSKLEIDALNGENVLYAQKWGDRNSRCRNIDITISGGTVEKMVRDNDTNVNLKVADNKWIEELTNLEYKYREKISPRAVAKLGTPTYSYTEYENGKEGTYTTETPSKVGKYYVKAEIKETSPNVGEGNTQTYITDLEPTIGVLEITQADSKISITQDMNKKYDGNPVENPEVSKEGSSNDVKFIWYKKNGNDWIKLDTAPTNVGEYKVVASVAKDANYKGAITEKEFTISKADTILTFAEGSFGKTYDGKPISAPKVNKEGSRKNVTFTWYVSYGNDWNRLDTAPTNAGNYKVVASVEEDTNYNGKSIEKSFEIASAYSSIKFKNGTKLDKIYDGKPVEITNEDVETSGSTGDVNFIFEKKVDGKFNQIKEVPTEVGRYRVMAYLNRDDNYYSASTNLEFTIYEKHETTEDNKDVNTSTDEIEINTGVTQGSKGVYLYCTESTEVPAPPTILSTLRDTDKWEEVTEEKHKFTGLKSNTVYHVWKYDDNKPEGQKLTYEYAIKTDSPSIPSKPSKPDEKPGIGVDVDVVDKIAGEDRYDTSVSISQKVFPSKSEKVYLVSGEKFPDALSSAALTGKGDGPILLINDKNIDKILAEIDRLDAKEIVFIGGNSISDVNEAKVRKFAKENSLVVSSFVGKDRYETAVKVAEQTIAKYGNKGKVIIADGRNYPDAVSIASYAAKEGIPVILVNGNKVPDVVKNFLNKYKINNAIIVGGNEAVGKDVEKLFKSVDRVAGEDRYETSKKIAEKFFSGSSTVFVASGESFADSLSVSYYAGAKNAPILLTKANSLDNDTREYLEKNKYKDYVLVGGDEAINPDLFK